MRVKTTWHINLRKNQDPPACIKAKKGIPPERMGFKKLGHAPGTPPGSTARDPLTDQATQLFSICFLVGSAAIGLEFVGSQELCSSVSVDFPFTTRLPHVDHIIPPPSL